MLSIRITFNENLEEGRAKSRFCLLFKYRWKHAPLSFIFIIIIEQLGAKMFLANTNNPVLEYSARLSCILC